MSAFVRIRPNGDPKEGAHEETSAVIRIAATLLMLTCFWPMNTHGQVPVFLAARQLDSTSQASPANRDVDAMTMRPMAAGVGPGGITMQGTELLPAPAQQSVMLPPGPSPGVTRGTDCGNTLSLFNRAGVCPRCGVDEAGKCCCDDGRWRQETCMQFSEYGQGEYVGPARLHHVRRYRMRVDDQVTLVYRLTRELDSRAYKFNVGDEVLVEGENLTGDVGERGNANLGDFSRSMVILPDGTITIPYIGQVRAAGRSVLQLRKEVQEKSKAWFKFPMWTITPIRVNTRLEDLRAVVDARAGQGGQSISLRVSPDGTIQPPAIGSVCVQGLTLDEAKFEIDQRYTQAGFRGIEVSIILSERAPSFIYVLGEVAQPGRFTLERPTTAMGAIALAGGWNIGGNLRQIIVFRRADDWRLIATRINLQGALMGRHPTPADEIFLRDSDIVLVPKNPIQRIDDAINLVFVQGINPLIAFGSAAGFLNLTFVD